MANISLEMQPEIAHSTQDASYSIKNRRDSISWNELLSMLTTSSPSAAYVCGSENVVVHVYSLQGLQLGVPTAEWEHLRCTLEY